MAESCVIIGLGQIGMGYDFDVTDESEIYTHTRAISSHPEFSLIGAVDVSPAQRARFEHRYNAPAFEHVEAALKDIQPDIVVIATPTSVHSLVLNKVVRNCEPKLILCEKPLLNDLVEAQAMVEICDEMNIALFVNYIYRTDSGVAEIKRRIDCGEISTPVKVNAWYSKGIQNNGSHFLNLLELWLGEISGASIINPGRLWDNHDPEPDVKIQFELGTVIFRAAWEECFSHYCIELLSRSGRLRYDKLGEAIVWQSVYADPNFDGYKILAEPGETIANGMNVYQWHVYDQICQYLAGAATSLCTGREALRTLEVIDLIIKQRQ